MKNLSIIFILCTIITTVLWECTSEPSAKSEIILTDSNIEAGQIIADTITYDVVIKNFDTSMVWQENFLKYLDRSLLIDSIFAGVYSGRFKPYDFFTGKEMSLRKVRDMENEPWFTRDGIGKIQFAEIWYFNTNGTSIEKKVYSIVLGLEQFDNMGNLKGHKPVFKIYLNQSEPIN